MMRGIRSIDPGTTSIYFLGLMLTGIAGTGPGMGLSIRGT